MIGVSRDIRVVINAGPGDAVDSLLDFQAPHHDRKGGQKSELWRDANALLKLVGHVHPSGKIAYYLPHSTHEEAAVEIAVAFTNLFCMRKVPIVQEGKFTHLNIALTHTALGYVFYDVYIQAIGRAPSQGPSATDDDWAVEAKSRVNKCITYFSDAGLRGKLPVMLIVRKIADALKYHLFDSKATSLASLRAGDTSIVGQTMQKMCALLRHASLERKTDACWDLMLAITGSRAGFPSVGLLEYAQQQVFIVESCP